VPGDDGAVDEGDEAPDDGDDGSLDGAGIPCAVRKVLSEHCTSCHGSPTRFGAPMSLLRHEDILAAGKVDASRSVHELMMERIHHEDPRLRMPPASQPALEAAELATLDGWLAAGAPRSDESCVPAGDDGGDGGDGDGDADGDDLDTTGLECFKLTAHAPGDFDAPYAVGVARDTYINFSFKAPWQGAGYGMVMRPLIDNDQVIHHWLLFQEASGVTDGEIAESSGTHPTGDLVYGWAPGGKGVDYRSHGDVGFEFTEGTGFVVELHYNSDDAAALDASGVELCVQKEKPANIAGVSWLGRDFFFYVSEQQSVCNPGDAGPIHIIGVSPHMHLKGKHMKGILNRADGRSEVIHDAPFSFSDQGWYPKDFVLMPGDTITTTCTWDGFVSFGKDTTEEMCYLFTVAYPKGALSDGLPGGIAAHGGSACLGL
jgi:hypothetical protein